MIKTLQAGLIIWNFKMENKTKPGREEYFALATILGRQSEVLI